jgi:hypothetical protein
MIKKVFFVSVLAFLFLFLSDISMAQNMKEGLWEVTMTMEMPGMAMKMPPHTYTHCMTKKDMVPQKQDPGQECKMVKSEVRGDTVSWVMECKTKEGIATSNGRLTYRGNAFDGVVKMKHAGTEMTQNLKGRWIGPCK